jgi:hypothetical protein
MAPLDLTLMDLMTDVVGMYPSVFDVLKCISNWCAATSFNMILLSKAIRNVVINMTVSLRILFGDQEHGTKEWWIPSPRSIGIGCLEHIRWYYVSQLRQPGAIFMFQGNVSWVVSSQIMTCRNHIKHAYVTLWTPPGDVAIWVYNAAFWVISVSPLSTWFSFRKERLFTNYFVCTCKADDNFRQAAEPSPM